VTKRILTIVLLAMSSTFAQWTPPPKPDPSTILNEAKTDAMAGRYGDALAKHLWFHHNALKVRRSLYGVRLSFALGYWMDLAKHYPPALEALKTTRDEAVARIRQGNSTRDDFHDVSSINEHLNEDEGTTELFVWLDEHNSKLATSSYGVAERSLIRSQRYELCGKYIDPKRSSDRMVTLYREHQRMAKEGRFGGDMSEFSQRSLSNSATTLVALLVLNGRTAEADDVVARVLREWPDENFRKALEKAKTGAVPEPWPPRGS